jgi:hypothetical protein
MMAQTFCSSMKSGSNDAYKTWKELNSNDFFIGPFLFFLKLIHMNFPDKNFVKNNFRYSRGLLIYCF